MRKILKRLQGRELGMIAVSLVFIILQVYLDLKLPDYMSEITRLVQTPGSAVGDVWWAGLKMLLITLASAGTSVVVGYFASHVSASFSYRLRGEVFGRVTTFSMEEMNGFSTASLITRTTNDITQIQMIIAMGLQVLIKAPILAVWAMLKISRITWQWTTLTAVAVVALLAIVCAVMAYAMPRFRKIQTLTDNINRITRETLTGLRVVRAYNAESYQEARFEEANEDITSNNLSAHRAMTVFNPGMQLVISGMSIGIYWIGAYLIEAAGQLESKIALFSDMIVFSSYAMQMLMAFMMLTMVFIMAPRVIVSIRRVNEVLDTEPKINDGPGAVSDPAVTGEVEFRNVSFMYPGAEDFVMRDISFKAKKGETVAFIGSTGSGKSTLINLVPRFYDVTDGQVLIDGIDVREYTQVQLRDKLGYVPQRAVLFAGTVSDNVTFGDSPRELGGEDAVKRAVAVAQSTDFVEAMTGGYDADLSQGGTNLSGGQKQRLSIARAVYRKPEIYIFDDSFSALDYKTDRLLRSALKRETGGVTNLIVAQRIGTIREADKIIVLDEGKQVGEGTHDELMRSCEIYREIAYSQLSKEELGE
ncbi:MAG: ABC transporter ATP-binding protein/permease [Oscillospiraceae bacterium]|jgi:ATP-binding cassette subfamily B protein|nr:ABC transporter ATP-binding protein/permease [Oscillospiraceae bacterium]